MFAIKIQNKFLAIPDGQTFTMVKNSELFSTDLPEGEYSYPINLSLKDANVSEFFSGLRSIQSVKEFKSVDCQLYFRNRPIENNARLIFRKRRGAVIQGYVLTGSSIFAQALKNTAINEIDYGGYYIGTEQSDMINHMKDTAESFNDYNHVFAPVFAPIFKKDMLGENTYFNFINNYNYDNGFFMQNDSFQAPHITAYVPFPKLIYIIKGIFNHFGLDIKWSLFDNPDFKKIVLINNAELSSEVYPKGFRVTNTNEQIINDEFTYTSFDDDATGDNFNDFTLFNLGLNYYTITQVSVPHPFEYEFTIEKQGSLLGPEKVFVEVLVDGERYWLMDHGFLDSFPGNVATINQNTNVNRALVGAFGEGFYGKKLQIRAFIGRFYGPAGTASVETFPYKITNAKWGIVFADPKPVLVGFKEEIEYRQHLSDMSCSEFLNTIRKRFNAHVSKIDFQNNLIEFAQNISVFEKKTSKPLFSTRNLMNEMSIDLNVFIFENDFDGDDFEKEQKLLEPFKKFKAGMLEEEDVENNELTMTVAPIFFQDFETVNGIRTFSATAFEGDIASNFATKIRLGFYHGFQPLDENDNDNKLPFLSPMNVNNKGEKIGGFNLSFHLQDGLWEIFYKKWYEKLFLKEKYTFEIYPDAQEMKDFKFDKLDFYEFAEFVAEKVEFKLRGNKLLSSKFDCVKLNR